MSSSPDEPQAHRPFSEKTRRALLNEPVAESCSRMPKGHGYCDKCAAGLYDQCRYVPHRELAYGECARCGGNLVTGHQCPNGVCHPELATEPKPTWQEEILEHWTEEDQSAYLQLMAKLAPDHSELPSCLFSHTHMVERTELVMANQRLARELRAAHQMIEALQNLLLEKQS